MSLANNSGLASLTATYTDSEGEEEHEPDIQPGTVILTEESSLSKPPTPVENKKRRNVKRLVSYHDDTYVSSEGESSEGEDNDSAQQTNDYGLISNTEDVPLSEEAKALAELHAKATAAAADGVKLPDEPKGKCSTELQEKINRFYDRMVSGGLDMNRVIQQKKDFRNPSIYEKLIQYCKINELGTNYPTEIYDPLRWGKESYYEELAKVQKTDMDKREKERKEKAKVEIMTGTAKRNLLANILPPGKISTTVTSTSAAQSTTSAGDEAKRKSKWDQVAGANQQTALTANVTGTKSTVISAFGSLPKRPRI
ncbi:hypothetical protein B566_EDAN010673 [Ephemera danica]|nr:hypothetical protein B566_EDAN010673 [Ephemera danica]